MPFQYFRFISNKDELFKWLPSKIHLTFPIYLDVEDNYVYLDYTDPHNPSIINKKFLEEADTEYDLDEDAEIVYNELQFSFQEQKTCFTQTILAGLPDWIQRDDTPKCPKTGKTMRFVCQINGGVTTKRTNFEIDEKDFGDCYEYLNFGDCNLYVFFEPTSKVACYFLQGS